VRGITILTTTKKDDKWQFVRWDVEFNNIGYLANIGGTWSMPGAAPAAY
jgi:hypothetical protein